MLVQRRWVSTMTEPTRGLLRDGVHRAAIAEALRDIGYVGTVGMEAWASVDGVAGSEAALDAFS
jgi:hydroxypyruvate isomerase